MAGYMQTSKTSEWETPQQLFDELNQEFRFTLDAAASLSNYKCPRFYTQEQDGLKYSWADETVWVNPPYGPTIRDWVAKASEQARVGATVVMLLPARTDTRWFHEHVWDAAHHRPRQGVELRLLRGRLKFGGCRDSAPFPSMIVVFRSREVSVA